MALAISFIKGSPAGALKTTAAKNAAYAIDAIDAMTGKISIG